MDAVRSSSTPVEFEEAAIPRPPSDSPKRPLRFAVILDSESIARWQADVLERLVASGDADVVAFILPEREKAPRRVSFREVLGSLVYFLARLTIWKPNLFRHRPIPDRWAGVPRLRCRVERKGSFSDYFAAEDVRRLREARFDFILKFGLRILRGAILRTPRYGVWSFHHGDEREVRGRPAGFWEIYHGMATTGVVLQRLTERLDGGIILKRGNFPTKRSSYVENLRQIYGASADFPALVCSDILRGDAPYLESGPSGTRAPIFKNPTNAQTLKCLARIALAKAGRLLYGAFRLKVWSIGLIHGSVDSLLDPRELPRVRWLTSRERNAFVADPFLVRGSRGRTWLLYEHLNYNTLRGRIGCLELGTGSDDVDGHAALIESHHLSYPCSFRHEGVTYCVPEEGRSGRVRLFRFDEHDRKLTEVATLLQDIRAIDPTVFFHEGLWWIACTDSDQGQARLMLWHSPALTGPYVPHRRNPVKIDIRTSRPAGNPFTWKGKLYRPAQDMSGAYGEKIHVQEIVRLDPLGFEERTACTLHPFSPAYSKGLHHLSTSDGWTVVDGYREVFHPLAWYFRLKSVFAKTGALRGSDDRHVRSQASLDRSEVAAPALGLSLPVSSSAPASPGRPRGD